MAQEQHRFLDYLKVYFLPRSKQSFYNEVSLSENNNLFRYLSKKVFFDAYPGDGVTPLSFSVFVNGRERRRRDVMHRYAFRSWLTSFLGLPNRFRKAPRMSLDRMQTSDELLLDLVGWSVDHSLLRNVMKIPFVVPFNVLRVCLTTPVSLLKLFTEVFPDFLSSSIGIGMFSLGSKIGEWRGIKKILGVAAGIVIYPLLSLAYYASKLWMGLGMLITSPIKAASMAFALGKSVGGVPGVLLSHIFSGMSYLASLALYTTVAVFLGPFALQGLEAVLPWGMNVALSEGLLLTYSVLKGWITTLSVMVFGVSFGPQTQSILSTAILTAGLGASVRILEEVGERLGVYFSPKSYQPAIITYGPAFHKDGRPRHDSTYKNLAQKHPANTSSISNARKNRVGMGQTKGTSVTFGWETPDNHLRKVEENGGVDFEGTEREIDAPTFN